MHTEPWLAHPTASAAASAGADAAVTTTKYVLTDQSRILVELGTRRGKVRGKLTRVSGELELALSGLAQSHGEVRAELGSLALDEGATEDDAAWLTRAQSALGLGDGGVDAASSAFTITALSEVSVEAVTAETGKHVRGVAEGDLLLNGFRVSKRVPLEAEFGFAGGAGAPTTVAIRSRAPLVLTLETHEIHLREAPARPPGAGSERHRARPPSSSHDIRLTLELYAAKP